MRLFLDSYCGATPEVDNARVVEFPNGTSLFTGAQVGDTVTYECVDDAVPSGSLEIMCQDNRQWETPPQCSSKN